MKKIITTLVVAFFISTTSIAQIKEGSVTYDMKMEGLPPEQAAMMGDMETKVTFKNGKVLSEMTSMMMSSQILIDENGMLMLMEQMGNKIAMKQTKEELEKIKSKENSADPKIEYINDVKMIAGYECKKALITFIGKDKKEETIEMWYCEKFDNPNKDGNGKGQAIMKGLKGMPFEYAMAQGPMKFKMLAKQVTVDPVADDTFKLSTEGYKLMTMDDLKALQGGR